MPLWSVRGSRGRAGARARVLVVDDEPDIVEILQDDLTNAGHEVVTALTGPEALRSLAHVGADVVLLDISMPGMDGLEVLRRIRASGVDVPVIIASGNLEPALVRQLLDLGALDCVGKPFDFQHLRRAVTSALASAC